MTKKTRKIYLWNDSFIAGGFDKLCHKYLDMPDSATLNNWELWENKQKEEHPILFFCLKTMPRWTGFQIFKLTEKYYQVSSKYVRRQHHIKIDIERFVEPGLNSYHWYDSDFRILYGCFQVLVEFVEDEEAEESIDWSSNTDTKRAWEEIQLLYKWWTEERDKREDNYPDPKDYGLKHGDMFKIKQKESPELRRYMKASEEAEKREHEFEVEDTEMLIRLVTIRNWLWT